MSLSRRAIRSVSTRSAFVPTMGGDPWAIPSNASMAGWTSAGVPVNDKTAMQLLIVSACARILSDTLAGRPFYSVTDQPGGWKLVVDPTPRIVSDPFGGQNTVNGVTRREGFGMLMLSLLFRGNAYAYVTAYDKNNKPAQLQVLAPDMVDVGIDDKTGERTYTINRNVVETNRMLHIVGMQMPGDPKGLSVISYARNAIALGLAAEQFGSQFFARGAHLTGIIQIPGDLDKTGARKVKDAFEATHSGVSQSHQVGVLTAGAEWKPISVTPEEAQFLGTRAAQNLDLAMLFGVPPHMLGQVDRTTSWGKGIEEQKLGFLNFTMDPWFGKFEDAWSGMLPRQQSGWFDLDSFLRADTKTRYATYGSARNAALLTVNEIRAKENLPPVEGGDEIYAPINSAHTINTVTDDNDDDLEDDGKEPDPASPDPTDGGGK